MLRCYPGPGRLRTVFSLRPGPGLCHLATIGDSSRASGARSATPGVGRPSACLRRHAREQARSCSWGASALVAAVRAASPGQPGRRAPDLPPVSPPRTPRPYGPDGLRRPRASSSVPWGQGSGVAGGVRCGIQESKTGLAEPVNGEAVALPPLGVAAFVVAGGFQEHHRRRAPALPRSRARWARRPGTCTPSATPEVGTPVIARPRLLRRSACSGSRAAPGARSPPRTRARGPKRRGAPPRPA